ncbi:MAG TPA: uracil-DNA glycosylase [Methanoculleus sp.]|nr:uracil-DNA glycosylase [Methanoculleus sp.]
MNESEMEQLKREVRQCTKCPLSASRTHAVPGEGPEDARVLFIGEAPGKNEDRQGRPFVGRAGAILDELLASIGLARGDVYITNIVKCRPPGNRDPAAGEIEACSGYLDRQLDLIAPAVVVTLGRFAMQAMFRRSGVEAGSIGEERGTVHRVGDLALIPVYHPAAAIYDPNKKDVLLEDFRTLRSVIDGNA